jgi:hypothetical protein
MAQRKLWMGLSLRGTLSNKQLFTSTGVPYKYDKICTFMVHTMLKIPGTLNCPSSFPHLYNT